MDRSSRGVLVRVTVLRADKASSPKAIRQRERSCCRRLGRDDRFEEPFITALHACTHCVAAVETRSAPGVVQRTGVKDTPFGAGFERPGNRGSRASVKVADIGGNIHGSTDRITAHARAPGRPRPVPVGVPIRPRERGMNASAPACTDPAVAGFFVADAERRRKGDGSWNGWTWTC